MEGDLYLSLTKDLKTTSWDCPRQSLLWSGLISASSGADPIKAKGRDCLSWGNSSGNDTVREGYILYELEWSSLATKNKVAKDLDLMLHPNVNFFFWILSHNKLLTADNLFRAISGTSWCVWCKAESESSSHLFLKFEFTSSVCMNLLTLKAKDIGSNFLKVGQGISQIVKGETSLKSSMEHNPKINPLEDLFN